MKRREEEAEAETLDNDILAPFWDEKIPMNEVLSRAEAQKLKNEVLNKFKERIISRADIIDKRIKEEKALVRTSPSYADKLTLTLVGAKIEAA